MTTNRNDPLKGQPIVWFYSYPSTRICIKNRLNYGLTPFPRQFGNLPCRGVLLVEEIQHRHEMALAAAETAEQVTRLAGAPFEGVAHQRKCIVEALGELGCDDLVPQCLFRTFQSFGQAEDKIPTAHYVGQVKKVFDEGGHKSFQSMRVVVAFNLTA